MKNFFKNKRELIAIFGWFLIVAALIWLVIFPLVNKINNLKDQIQEESLNQQITRQHLSELPKIQQQYTALKSDGNSIDVLLDKANAVVLIERLEKIADESNVKISIAVQDTQPQKTTPTVASKNKANDNTLVANLPNSNYLQLKISLDGNYNSIVKFASVVENFEYYSDIIDLDIKKNDANSQAAQQTNENGVLNPFDVGKNLNSNQSSTPTPTPTQVAPDNNLNATLDVVFYTKS